MELAEAKRAIEECDRFRSLSTGEKALLLWAATGVHFDPGHVITRIGSTQVDSFWLSTSGEAIMTERDELRSSAKFADPEAMNAPHLIGEIGPVNPNKERTATVKAADPMEALEWSATDLQDRYPGVWQKLHAEFESPADDQD